MESKLIATVRASNKKNLFYKTFQIDFPKIKKNVG